MASTYTPIATTTLGSDTATITFSSISSSYTDLYVVAQVRGTVASNEVFRMRFNSDTGTNYSYTRLAGDGTNAFSDRVSNAAYIDCGYMPGSNSTLSVFGIANINIMNYANSTTYKTAIYRWNDAGAVNAYAAAEVGLWRSTSAINTLTFSMLTGNLLAGSNITLYGILSA